MLQNRFGDTVFPVRDGWASARVYRQARMRSKMPRGRQTPPWVTLVVAVVALLLVTVGTAGGTPGGLTSGFSVAVIGAALLLVAWLAVSFLIDRRRPRLEQQRYWELTGAQPLSPRQQQLLALDAQSDYGFGGWNSSLEYAPAWSRMPEEMQQRHRQDGRWQPFVTMELIDPDQLRVGLDADWHIASSADLELFVVDALADRGLTARYAAAVEGEDGERRLSRMASLTGVDRWDLLALTTSSSPGQPARGLWAAETQRLISLIRMGYVAGHLDAPAAWDLIERAAAPAATRFDSWDAYWAEVRVGLAFSADRLDVLQQFDHRLAGLRASAWPAASAAFPAVDRVD